MKIYSSELNFEEEIEKAESGDVDAKNRVAFSILHAGKNKEIDEDEAELAIRYYTEAADAGDKSAMLDLAACYMDGRGVKRDVEKSLTLYEKGWDPDDPGACYCLGCINRYDYLEDQSEVPTTDVTRIQKAISYFERGEEIGGSDCMYELGELYLLGIGVPEDKEKAFQLFDRADYERDSDILSDRGLRILLRLAECWHYGWGTEADIYIAYVYMLDYHDELERRIEAEEKEEEHILVRARKEWEAISEETHEYKHIPGGHKCPVCGKYEFPYDASFDICEVCGWEDDEYQLDNPDEDGGANTMSLNEAREVYAKGILVD